MELPVEQLQLFIPKKIESFIVTISDEVYQALRDPASRRATEVSCCESPSTGISGHTLHAEARVGSSGVCAAALTYTCILVYVLHILCSSSSRHSV